MKRFLWLAMFSVLAGISLGCAPTIVVENKTAIPVRVVISSAGRSQVFSPSPGESSAADVAEGAYHVTVIRDEEWIDYAKDVRKYLNDQLANSDKLSGPQLLDVIRRLKDIASRMAQYEAAGGRNLGCSGTVSQDKDGVAVISVGADGKLNMVCK